MCIGLLPGPIEVIYLTMATHCKEVGNFVVIMRKELEHIFCKDCLSLLCILHSAVISLLVSKQKNLFVNTCISFLQKYVCQTRDDLLINLQTVKFSDISEGWSAHYYGWRTCTWSCVIKTLELELELEHYRYHTAILSFTLLALNSFQPW